MSFDVFLIPSTASPVGGAYDKVVAAAVQSVKPRAAYVDGGITADGLHYEMYGGGDGVSFALRGLSPGMCELIFAVAKQTNSYVVASDDEPRAIKIKGTRGRPPKWDLAVRTVATPEAFCIVLNGGYGSWAGYAAKVRKHVNGG